MMIWSRMVAGIRPSKAVFPVVATQIVPEVVNCVPAVAPINAEVALDTPQDNVAPAAIVIPDVAIAIARITIKVLG